MVKYTGCSASYKRTPTLLFTLRCILVVSLVLLLAHTSFPVDFPTAFADEAAKAVGNEPAVFDESVPNIFDGDAIGELDDAAELETAGDDDPMSLTDSDKNSGLSAQSVKSETLSADTISVCTVSQLRNAVKKAPKNTLCSIMLTADINLGRTSLEIPSSKNIALSSGHAAGARPFILKTSNKADSAVLVKGGAVFSLEGIVIICARGYGVDNRGTFTMKSGRIENCKTGVYNYGTFTMANGIVSGCKDSGIINFSSHGTAFDENHFHMAGGSIINNSAKQGGGVHNEGVFTMTGGLIENNSAKGNGGGVWNSGYWIMLTSYQNCSFNMTGGSILNNTAQGNGGGVCNEGEDCETTQYGGAFKMTGGSIENNTAKKEGGGIYTYAYNKLTVGEKAEFSGNKAKGSYSRLSKSNKVYKSKIACKKWTAPFTQGYNNYDINYTGHAGLFTLVISGKTLGIEKSSKKIKKPAELQKKDYTATQRFNIKRVETNGTKDYYTITNVLSGKRLAVKGGKATKGAVIWQTKASKSKAQRFSFEKNPQGGYWISPKGSKLIFSLKSGKTDAGTSIVLAKKSKTKKTQGLALKEVKQPLPNMLHGFTNKKSKKVLEAQTQIEKSQTPLQLEGGDGSGCHWFSLVYDKRSGYYTIHRHNKRLAVDLKDGSMSAQTPVWFSKANSKSFSQKWFFKKNKGGTYTIINAKSGKVLEPQNGCTATGTPILANNPTSSKTQRWSAWLNPGI